MKIRVSIGTLAVLGMTETPINDAPTTVYLLQYSAQGCMALCGFCLQSRRNYREERGDMLGRVVWPVIEVSELIEKLSEKKYMFTRVCLQTVLKQGFFSEALAVIDKLRERAIDLPISLATTPVGEGYLREARNRGVDYLGIGLDAATESLFTKWGKPYTWSTYWRFIEKAVGVFGRGHVYVHLIVGLGESFTDLVKVMGQIYRAGARVALFAYTGPKGMPQVDIRYYRLAQIARHLIELGDDPLKYINPDKLQLEKQPADIGASAFYTSGCPGCNRPYYNEKPSGPIFNISSREQLLSYAPRLRAELREIGVKSEVLYSS